MSQPRYPTITEIKTLEFLYGVAVCESCKTPHEEGVIHVGEFDLRSNYSGEILESWESLCEDCEFDFSEELEREEAELATYRYP